MPHYPCFFLFVIESDEKKQMDTVSPPLFDPLHPPVLPAQTHIVPHIKSLVGIEKKKRKKKLTVEQRMSKVLSGHKKPIVYFRELPSSPQSRVELCQRYDGILDEIGISEDVQIDDFAGNTMVRVFKNRLPVKHLECMQGALCELCHSLPSKHGMPLF